MLGPQLGIVLRSSSGANFLIQTHRIPGKIVQDAVADALEALGHFKKTETHHEEKNAMSFQGSNPYGDFPPNFALGQILVLQGNYLVTYRLVSSVLVMLVSESETNAFLRLRMLDAATKILVGASKGVNVSASTLSKRYMDVHSLLGELLGGGLAELPPAFIHTSATSENLAAMPISASDAARRLKRLARGSAKGSAFVPEKSKADDDGSEPSAVALPETPTKDSDGKAFSVEIGDPLNDVEFNIPPDALPPPPARALGAMRRPPAPPTLRNVEKMPVAFAGAIDDETTAGKMEAEEEGKESENQPEEWNADFGAQNIVEEKESAPVISVEDLRHSLQLVEIYHGEVVDGTLVRAGVEGGVRRKLAPYGLSSANFRILPSNEMGSNISAWVSRRNEKFTREIKNDKFQFEATLSGAPMEETYLKYQLASSSLNPPIQLELILAPQAEKSLAKQKPTQWRGLLILRWVVNPDLNGPLLDVVIDIDLPAELSDLKEVSPAAQFCQREGRIRWNIGKIEPGASGLARAILASKPDEQLAARAEKAFEDKELFAKVLFTCWPGRSLSGLGFEVAMPGEESTSDDVDGTRKEFYQGKFVSFGEIIVKP